jgi:hypothetical protein
MIDRWESCALQHRQRYRSYRHQLRPFKGRAFWLLSAPPRIALEVFVSGLSRSRSPSVTYHRSVPGIRLGAEYSPALSVAKAREIPRCTSLTLQ